MDFSDALQQLKDGKKLRRRIWEPDYYIVLPRVMPTLPHVPAIKLMTIGRIELHDRWSPMAADLLAEDWSTLPTLGWDKPTTSIAGDSFPYPLK
jgi:Protein of unknown function (DUF2829)